MVCFHPYSFQPVANFFHPFPWKFDFAHVSTSFRAASNRRLRGLHDENLPIAFNKVLQACSRARRWEHALSVLRRMCQSEALIEIKIW